MYDHLHIDMNICVLTYLLSLMIGFPVFAGTPNNWLNLKSGGLEWQMVTGLKVDDTAQRSFIDYEPVSGRGLRNALRQELNMRVETGPLFMSAFTGQALCSPPTKAYSASSGYGCFAYIPTFWSEDGRVVNTEEFYRRNDHFYTRPKRALDLIKVGLGLGLFFLALGSCLLIRDNIMRKRFKGRIYVD
jgi:hypothetical protein